MAVLKIAFVIVIELLAVLGPVCAASFLRGVDYNTESNPLTNIVLNSTNRELKEALSSNTITNELLPANGSEFLDLVIRNIGNIKYPLVKKVFSDNTRLLFVAGLEGTGHHAMRAMFDVCKDEARLCDVAVNLNRLLNTYQGKGNIMHGLFSGADVPLAQEQIQTMFEFLKNLAARKTRAVIHIAGLAYVLPSGMMSYPNYDAKYKVLDHPDIAFLAYAAEMAGLDLRVIVLQRPASEVLASTMRRSFGGVTEPRILTANAEALYTQMSMLHPSFYHCVQYHTLGNMSDTQQQSFRHFLHPHFTEGVMHKMLSKIEYNHNITETDKANATVMASLQYEIFQLQSRQQLMDNLCEQQHALDRATLTS